jgi:hypothetical protein
MDVPEYKTYESRLAAKMLTPGAVISGCPNIKIHVLEARWGCNE